MRVLKIAKKDNFLEVVPQSADDLWHLEKIIEKGDVVSGSTERKIKPKEPGAKPFKQKMSLDIQVEEVSFHKFDGSLRVSGVILGGRPEEFVDLKAHHTLSFNPGEKVKIKKTALKNFHLERLKKAEAAFKKPKLLVVLMDDEVANFGVLSDYGLEEKAKIFSQKSGKRFTSDESTKYFYEVLAKIKEVGLKQVLIAGPGFTKSNFQKFLQDQKTDFNYSVHAAASIGKTGFSEVLKKGIGPKAVQEMEVVQEAKLLEEVFAEIGKDGLVAYGPKEVKKAVEFGAVKELLLAEHYFLENRLDLEPLMDLTEKRGGLVRIIDASEEAKKKLANLGGIVALLRFKLE